MLRLLLAVLLLVQAEPPVIKILSRLPRPRSPRAQSDAILSGDVNFVRVVPADDIQGSCAAEWAKSLGFRKVYVLDDRELYGKGIADIFCARAEELGLSVLGRDGIDPKSLEFKSLLTKIKAT